MSRRSVPPTALVLVAVSSVQIGAAVAKTLFDEVGPAGVVLLRLVFGMLGLVLLGRPRLSERRPSDLLLLLAFGATLACMNLAFYAALDRVPLGIAVTLEFVGPLGVAIAGSRRMLDFVWVVLAGAGIVLLADSRSGSIHPLGIVFALTAGAFWAAYILISARTGRVFPGASGLAVATGIALVFVAPVGIASAGADLFQPHVVAVGAAVGILSSGLPWALELEALRRLPTHLFGVLMSLEPAVAAVSGFVILGQHLALRALVAIALVMIASAGASRAARGPIPPEP